MSMTIEKSKCKCKFKKKWLSHLGFRIYKTHWLWQLAFISNKEHADHDLEKMKTKWLKRVINWNCLHLCASPKTSRWPSRNAWKTRPPLLYALTKALKEIALIIFLCEFWLDHEGEKSNYILCTVGNVVMISFCKASTATEAPCDREEKPPCGSLCHATLLTTGIL